VIRVIPLVGLIPKNSLRKGALGRFLIDSYIVKMVLNQHTIHSYRKQHIPPFKAGLLIAVFLAAVVSFNLSALDFYEGKIKLNINDNNGSVSLYWLTDPDKLSYAPLFNDREKRASYISVNVDRTVYKPGFSNLFRTRVESQNGYPSIIFESLNLTITEALSPVRTPSSQETNVIKITITIQNTSDTPVSAGFMMLLDTILGEKTREHFITNRQMISKETLFRGSDTELFWISKNQDYSLMGSIADPLDKNARAPDSVHFANWRRLYNVPWTLTYKPNRSFNNLPYSIQDSAVCYYWEPAQLEAGDSFTYSIYLTTEDQSWYGLASAFNLADMKDLSNNDNMLLMLMLQDTLKKFIAGEIYLDAHDLDEIESTMDKIKADGYR
jgi:hypothetical protein